MAVVCYCCAVQLPKDINKFCYHFDEGCSIFGASGFIWKKRIFKAAKHTQNVMCYFVSNLTFSTKLSCVKWSPFVVMTQICHMPRWTRHEWIRHHCPLHKDHATKTACHFTILAKTKSWEKSPLVVGYAYCILWKPYLGNHCTDSLQVQFSWSVHVQVYTVTFNALVEWGNGCLLEA